MQLVSKDWSSTKGLFVHEHARHSGAIEYTPGMVRDGQGKIRTGGRELEAWLASHSVRRTRSLPPGKCVLDSTMKRYPSFLHGDASNRGMEATVDQYGRLVRLHANIADSPTRCNARAIGDCSAVPARLASVSRSLELRTIIKHNSDEMPIGRMSSAR